MKTYKKLILVGLLAALMMVTVSCSVLSGPKAAVKGFFNALDNSDVEKAIGYLSTGTIDTIGYSKWITVIEEMIDEIAAKGGIEEIDIGEEITTGDFSQVDVGIRFGDGSYEDSTIELVKEDGAWKIEMNPFLK